MNYDMYVYRCIQVYIYICIIMCDVLYDVLILKNMLWFLWPIWSIGCLRELVLSTGVGSCGTSWKSTIRIEQERNKMEQRGKNRKDVLEEEQIHSEGMGYQLWAHRILAACLSHFATLYQTILFLCFWDKHVGEAGDAAGPESFRPFFSSSLRKPATIPKFQALMGCEGFVNVSSMLLWSADWHVS